jgi:hypothetical protein
MSHPGTGSHDASHEHDHGHDYKHEHGHEHGGPGPVARLRHVLRPHSHEPDADLVDPVNTGLGHRPVQRWNLPEGWVISARPAHPAIVTEADFIAAQDLVARPGPDSPADHHYLLAGLLRCGICGRLLESCWSNGNAAYRCRHGHTTATRPDPARPPNAYIREDQILPRLPALSILLGAPARSSRKQGTAHPPVPARAAAMISHLRARGVTLIYDPDEHTLRAGPHSPISVTPTAKRRQQGENKGLNQQAEHPRRPEAVPG